MTAGARSDRLEPVAPDGVGVRIDASLRLGRTDVLDRFELSVAPGEVVGLVGPSGCGKTSLLELVAGLREPTSGSVETGGASDAAGRLERCALMPQSDLLLPWADATANAAIGLEFGGDRRRAARERAAEILRRFGLEGFEASRPAQLSGGMRQRVAFARSILSGKPVLLLDEPFGALDAITRASMQDWLAGELGSAALGRPTVLLVTHDVEEALLLCDRVAILAPRPSRVIELVASPSPRSRPRAEALADPELAALRARATRLLGGSA
ncbi:ABC transporter ATP-binding protein [Thermoleophilia bacterium SCSIO 60948]|nr:ABC transporter ATP-binding protein [Thermoleophilia bacterium SCSIO 60948]